MARKMTDTELFAMNLRQLMQEYDINQIELSKLCGVLQCNISTYCRGIHMPTMQIARKMAAVFGVTLDRFFEGDRQPVLFEDADLQQTVAMRAQANAVRIPFELDDMMRQVQRCLDRMQQLFYAMHAPRDLESRSAKLQFLQQAKTAAQRAMVNLQELRDNTECFLR